MSERPSDLPSVPPYPPVAVVGLACRFPGAPDLARFWQNLREGVASIRTLDADELRARGVPEALLVAPGYVRAAPARARHRKLYPRLRRQDARIASFTWHRRSHRASFMAAAACRTAFLMLA